ncbi:MAG: hypothetical protein QOD72_1668, partial [Acidimicrobiaceae bacterium]|nr:hypothetical protein [Acidimicrobiaceae bacterium]
FGQNLYDFPISGDNGNFLIMRGMAVFISDWSLIVNGFLLFTFYTSAWSSYLSLRWLRCGRISAVVCALLFAFAPYHFIRGEGHLFLSSYFVIPIAVLLTVRASSGRPLIARGGDFGMDAPWPTKTWFHVRSTLPWVVLCLACASFGSYYMFFTVVTIAMAALVIAANQRSIRPLLTAVSYCSVIVAMFAFNILPNLLYRAKHGVNPVAGIRQPGELDVYGLRLIQILTPVPGQKLRFLSDATEKLGKGYVSEPAQYFGLVASAAFLLMLGWLAIAVLTPRRSPRADVRALLGCLTAAWILIATTGGLDWFLTLINFTQIRAWNRVSILLMFTSLAWLALTIAPKMRRWAVASSVPGPVILVLVIAILVFALADQSSAVPDPSAYVNSFDSDKAFFATVEHQLPRAAMVYQLPYRRFPESPALFASADYDLLRPYLQTESLRWSYGGMKGRESDWQAKLTGLPAEELTRDVVAAGFQAYVIDRAGYDDHGAQIEASIREAIGRPALASPDGRWSFFDLTGLSDRFGSPADLAALKEELLNSPRVNLRGCSATEGAGTDEFNWCTKSGGIEVIDPTPDSANVFRATATAPAGAGTLTLTVAGTKLDVAIGPDATPINLTVPPGRDVLIQFKTDVPAVDAPGDSRDLRFKLVFPRVSTGP